MSRGVDKVSVDFGTIPFVAGEEPRVPDVELLLSGFAVMIGSVELQAEKPTETIKKNKEEQTILRMSRGLIESINSHTRVRTL